MLKEFHVKNFLSFHEEQAVSLEAFPEKKISEWPEHVTTIGDQRILKLCSFYGPNGGGKSNLLTAINTLQSVVLGISLTMKSLSSRCTFHHAFSPETAPTFSIYFATEIGEIGYELEVSFSKGQVPMGVVPIAVPIIKREEAIFRPVNSNEWESLYVRDESGLVESEILRSIDLIANKRRLNASLTFLGYIGNTLSGISNNDKELMPLLYLFREFRSIYTFMNLNTDGLQFPLNLDVVPAEQREEFLKKLSSFLCEVGIPVEGVSLEQISPYQAELVFKRKLPDGTISEIPFNMESAGTKKLTSLFLETLVRPDIGVILADDFDAALHPLLTSAILKYFGSKNNQKRQLIANSHDILNMTNEHFRRDEIWFASRDESYQTVLISLADIVNYEGKQIRKDAKYGKQYLEGLYGSDPFIQKGVKLFDA